MCAQGSSGAAQALDMHTDGKEHLNPPHSVWHGHGRVLLLLVAVHLAAFLYWYAGSLPLSAVGHVQAVQDLHSACIEAILQCAPVCGVRAGSTCT